MPPKASNAKKKGASGYELPEHINVGTVVEALGQKGLQFRFGKSIGTGGFGEIYLASKDVSRNVGDDATLGTIHILRMHNCGLFTPPPPLLS